MLGVTPARAMARELFAASEVKAGKKRNPVKKGHIALPD